MSSLSSAKSLRQLLGAPPSTASVQDSTLIIIDAQDEYACGNLQIEGVSDSRKVISDLLTKYRTNRTHSGRNIVHIVHQTPPGAPVFTPGTHLEREFEELAPVSGEKLITKNFPSSFAQTELHEYLSSLGDIGKKIVLVGYMAHVCVSTTARAGNELGYEVVVVRDAVGDRNIPGVKAATLKDVALSELEDAFATVISAHDITA